MTYADWQAEERVPRTPDELVHLADKVLAEGTWLKRWFQAHRFDDLRVLDLGCGSGVFSAILAKAGGDVTAVDITEVGVRLARATAEANRLAVKVVRMDAENLPFRAGAFDYVFSWGVLHHTSDMSRAVNEAGRVLKSGGRGIMMVYHRSSVVYWIHGLFWLIVRGKLFNGYTMRTVQDFYTDGFYHRYLTRQELSAMLGDADLQPARVTITQYRKKILPLVPGFLDEFLKSRFGMCLVIEFVKSDAPMSVGATAYGAQGGRVLSREPSPAGRRWMSVFFWSWILAAFSAYLFQFRDLVRPVLSLLGLSGSGI